jgi:hypothetical protein
MGNSSLVKSCQFATQTASVKQSNTTTWLSTGEREKISKNFLPFWMLGNFVLFLIDGKPRSDVSWQRTVVFRCIISREPQRSPFCSVMNWHFGALSQLSYFVARIPPPWPEGKIPGFSPYGICDEPNVAGTLNKMFLIHPSTTDAI